MKGNLDLQVCDGFRGTRVLDEVSGVFDRDFFLAWHILGALARGAIVHRCVARGTCGQ